MPTISRTILIVDDDRLIHDRFSQVLKSHDWRLLFAISAAEARRIFASETIEVAVLDIGLQDSKDLGLLKEINEKSPSTDVIMLTRDETAQTAVAAMRAGANDYVVKPLVGDEMLMRIEKVFEMRDLRRSNDALAQKQEYLVGALQQRDGVDQMVGSSRAWLQAVDFVRKFGKAEMNVLIQGESGTGKELVARALHYGGSRRSSPFVPVNVAALSKEIITSQFFGHSKGAFTGASESKKGFIGEAEDGTLFLDEIGEFPLENQPVLLRVIQEKRYIRVGDSRERECSARFVFATNRNLQEEVKHGRFRADLFHRINASSITLPPLRERLDDVPLLADHFVRKQSAALRRTVRLHLTALELLKKHSWPGNVRELENALITASHLLEDGENEIGVQHLMLTPTAPSSGLTNAQQKEKTEIIDAMKRCDGNQSEVARILGYHRNTISRKLRYYGITSSWTG